MTVPESTAMTRLLSFAIDEEASSVIDTLPCLFDNVSVADEDVVGSADGSGDG